MTHALARTGRAAPPSGPSPARRRAPRARRSAVAAVGVALVLAGAGCGGDGTEPSAVAATPDREAATEEGSADAPSADAPSADAPSSDAPSGAGAATDGSLPEGWPSEVPLPVGAGVIAATTTEDPRTHHVTASVRGELDAVYDELEAGLVDAGLEVDPSGRPSAGDASGSLRAEGAGLVLTISVYDDLPGTVAVAYTVAEAG